MAAAVASRSVRSTRPKRRATNQRIYREPDSESDFELEPVQTSHRPVRHSRQVRSYRENSEDDDDTHTDLTTSDSEQPRRAASQPSSSRSSRPRTSSEKSRQTAYHSAKSHDRPRNVFQQFKRQKLNPRTQSKKTRIVVRLPPLRPNARAPPWQNLEYQILVKIMQYAAYPLYSNAARSNASVQWLVDVSTLCRSFHEAAIAALMWSPPLLPSDRAHGLIGLLSSDQSRLSLDYRHKVHALDIETRHLLMRKSGIQLIDLIPHTPLLVHLRIFHGYDEMVGKATWAAPRCGRDKWSYEGLFDILDHHNVRLRSFEWNGRYRDTLEAMLINHNRPCMKRLHSIDIVNFIFAEKELEHCATARHSIIAALDELGELSTLGFSHCSILDADTVAKLPRNLTKLSFIDCFGLTSESLESYLAEAGNSLTHLHLAGNQTMDLGFMSSLGGMCPNLIHLLIDLSYQDCSSYRDSEPLYDELLPSGSPSWPTLLESIIIGPLRSLSLSDAEDFYTSLITAAPRLKFLRTLSLKTLLKEAGWRDRARLRSKWLSLFEQVFLADNTYVSQQSIRQEAANAAKRRKSTRIQELEDVHPPGTPDVATEFEGMILSRQGKCDILEFELSDQRPAQEQYREEHFLDDEPSDDGEWHG